jgi:hypothetical protein
VSRSPSGRTGRSRAAWGRAPAGSASCSTPDAASLDDEEELLGETAPGVALAAEEAAMHVEPDR